MTATGAWLCSCHSSGALLSPLPWANISRHDVPNNQSDQVGGDWLGHLEYKGVVLLLLPARGTHHSREALRDLTMGTEPPISLTAHTVAGQLSQLGHHSV